MQRKRKLAELAICLLVAASCQSAARAGSIWPTFDLTYSFVPDGSLYNGGSLVAGSAKPNYSVLFSMLDARLPRDVWQAEFRASLDAWEAVTPFRFRLVDDDGSKYSATTLEDRHVGEMRFWGVDSLTSPALTSLPSSSLTAGEITLSAHMGWGVGPGSYDLRHLLMHEIGHALGLSQHNNDPTSIMSPIGQWYLDGPGARDVEDLRALYGFAVPEPTSIRIAAFVVLIVALAIVIREAVCDPKIVGLKLMASLLSMVFVWNAYSIYGVGGAILVCIFLALILIAVLAWRI